MITNEFAEAATELNVILKYLPVEYVEKIPKKLRSFFEKVESKTYLAKIDPNKNLEQQDVKEKTKDLITIIYKNYWCNETERNKIDTKLIENDKLYEESLLNKYNPDNILKNKQVTNINSEQTLEKISLVEVKETTIFTKFLSFIQNLFTKK